MVGKSSRHFASNSRIPENPFHEANPALFFCGLHSYIYIYIHVGGGSKGACIQVSEKFSQCRRWPGSRCAREFSDGKRKAANRAKLVRRALLGRLLLSFSRFIRPPLSVSLSLFFVSSFTLAFYRFFFLSGDFL